MFYSSRELVTMLMFSGLMGVMLLIGGLVYQVLAIRAVRGLKRSKHVDDCAGEHSAGNCEVPVSILMPMHGAPPMLEACIRSVLAQDHPDFQVVFGFHSETDAGLAVLRPLLREFPRVETTIVIEAAMAGSNPKNCNLANMIPAARHDIIVMVDSDVLLKVSDLRQICAPLCDGSETGAVTCLYHGVSASGLWSDLGAQYHDDDFIPSALVDSQRRGGALDICYGPVIAMHRSILEAIGGIASMANAVAQDHVLGLHLYRNGHSIRLAGPIVGTVVHEKDFRSLFAHELRWSRSTRALRPLDHALSLFMHPLVPGAALAIAAFGWVGAVLGVFWLALRFTLHAQVAKLIGTNPAKGMILIPVREVFNVLVWTISLLGRNVNWGTRRLRTANGEAMTSIDHARRTQLGMTM